MEIRKLVKAGLASYTVALPKNWILKNKLSKGDSLYILEKAPQELIISTEIKERPSEIKEITIVTDGKSLETIRREITAAYINNYSTILILGKELNHKEIRRFLHDFVALEIEEQTSDKICAKDLLNLKEISIDKTIKRMDMIVRSMIQDSIKCFESSDLLDSIIYRDFDVNRFYFLLMRLIKSALRDQTIALSFKVSNIEAVSYLSLITNLENIGDSVKNISSIIKHIDKDEKDDLLLIYKKSEQNYTDLMKAFYTNNKSSADAIASHREELFLMCENHLKKNHKIHSFKTVALIEEIETYICNIAKLIIDY
jgi:phosphate uptake regulator